MKDKQTLLWLYHNSKTWLKSMLALTLGNALFAGCGILFALACRSFIDGAAGGESTLLAKGLMVLAVLVSQLVLRIVCGKLGVTLQGGLEMSFKTKLLGKLLHKDYAHAARYHSGELMNRLTGDITVVSEGVATLLPDLVGLLTKLLCAIAVLYGLDRAFALIFAIGGLLLFFTTKFLRGRLKHLHKTMQEKDGVVRSFMQEVLESMIVIKTFGVEHEMEAKAAGLGRALCQAKLNKNNVSILANSGLSFIFSLGYLYALVWSTFGLVAKTLSFGTLTAILQLVGQVQAPFSGLSGLLPKVYGVIASAERLIELENLPDEREINHQAISVLATYTNLHSLTLEDVSFGYDREPVFDHVHLKIRKGDFVVVSGLSGIGKSTLFLLMLGVFSPSQGTICITLKKGEQIPIDRHTRKLFAYIPQGHLLLSGTIRENIAFVNPGAAEEEIMTAAQVSCADEFIAKLPLGLDTVIGEKGQGLSEGQMQRLAIARAVLSGAPIVLLDEATSALDEATEETLLKNLKQMTDKTCIIISHKKAAFSVCNREIQIKNATIITTERSYHHVCHSA